MPANALLSSSTSSTTTNNNNNNNTVLSTTPSSSSKHENNNRYNPRSLILPYNLSTLCLGYSPTDSMYNLYVPIAPMVDKQNQPIYLQHQIIRQCLILITIYNVDLNAVLNNFGYHLFNKTLSWSYTLSPAQSVICKTPNLQMSILPEFYIQQLLQDQQKAPFAVSDR
eukprot:UN10287